MYDVIVQAGHEGRSSGVTGAAANGLREILLTPVIADSMTDMLVGLGYTVLRLPADGLTSQKAKIAIAVHLDGTPTSGAQMLFDDATDKPLADSLRLDWSRVYTKFIRDNTSPLADNTGYSRYYGFKYWSTTDGEVVMEFGSIGDPLQAALWAQPGYAAWAGRYMATSIANRLGSALKLPPHFGSTEQATPILGPATITPEHAFAWFNSRVTWSDVKHTKSQIKQIINAIWSWSAIAGVRPEVIFAQQCKETGFYTYGGQVYPDQFNFAGIGAVPDGITKGESWPDISSGVQGHVWRVALYAINDPHFHDLNIIKRSLATKYWGVHSTVEQMGDTWSGFKNGYGESMVRFFLTPMLSYQWQPEYLVEPWAIEAWREMQLAGVLSDSSRPDNMVSDQRLAVFLSRYAKAHEQDLL